MYTTYLNNVFVIYNSKLKIALFLLNTIYFINIFNF